MKRLAILAVTFNQDDPGDMNDWSVTGMRDMSGRSHGPWNGVDALTFMRQFDTVILWHFPPPEMVSTLKQYNVRVVPALALTDVETYPVWCRRNEQLRVALTGPLKVLRQGTRPNRFGSMNIDSYEADPAPAHEKPHVWSVEIDKTLAGDLVLHTLQTILEEYETDGYPDGLFIDTHLDLAYFGTASNAPLRPIIDWSYLDIQIARKIMPVWGHDAVGVTSCRYNLLENALRDLPLTDIPAVMQTVHDDDQLMALCPNNGQTDVDKLLQLAQWGIVPDFIQAARSGSFCMDDVDTLGR